MFNLANKTALVTGASGGIGVAIVKALHAHGARVVLSGTREEALHALVSSLRDRAYSLTCDLSQAQEAEALIERAENLVGELDIIVCNAGITQDNLALRMTNEAFLSVVDVNLYATFLINREAIKRMIRKKWGRIINISSVVAVKGNVGQANYAASKAGMIGMSKSLAAEVASRNITVNCIAPGFIETPMTDELTDKQKEKILDTIPAGKMGVPADVASGVVFLASEEAQYITGQTLHINGGMLMV